MAYVNYDAQFNGNRFPDVPGLSVLGTDPYKPAKRELSISSLARSHRSKLNSPRYNEKTLTIRCSITRATRDQAEQSFDQLMGILQGEEGSLIIKQAGKSRKYEATYQDTNFLSVIGSYFEFDLIFKTSDHFGYDTDYTVALDLTGQTGSARTDAVTFEGSAPTQVPTYVIQYGTITGGTAKTVTLSNDSTGQTFQLTRNWVSNDRLEVNAATGVVKVNGSEIDATYNRAYDFTGAIPEFAKGLGSFTYSDNLTTRTYSNKITYYKRYV